MTEPVTTEQREAEIAQAINTASDMVRDLRDEGEIDSLSERTIMAALDGACDLLDALRAARAALEEARAALTRIAKREGPYSVDRLTHAENTIDAMARIAEEALAASPTPSGGTMEGVN